MRTVAAFTGNRAEYGLLYPILKAIHEDPRLRLQLYVGGDHLRLGTVAEIEADGLPIHQLLNMPVLAPNSSPAALMSHTTAHVLLQLQQAFEANPPDLCFILGDRFETYAATLAAFYQGLPIAHLGGGDVTEGGCVDDTLRFLISQMAHLHFVLSQESRDRLIQRGEASWRIDVTGSPVIDNLLNTSLIPKATLCEGVGLDPDQPILLFTQHPIPAEGAATVQYFQQSLEALVQLPVQVIATEPNRDGYAEALDQVMYASRQAHPNIRWVSSLGRQRYLSWMAACDAVVGNSSSGLIETPFFKKPSITVGPRQAGRLRARNVISVPYGQQAVQEAVERILSDAAFRESLTQCANPFGTTPCAPQICERLATVPLNVSLLSKILSRQEETSYAV